MTKLAVGAGHGGSDTGAVYGKYIERDLARNITAQIDAQAKARGLAYTDVTDNDSSLANDIARVNASGADVAIQNHINAGVGNAHTKNYGIEVWHDDETTAATRQLAGRLAENLNAFYKLPNRGAKPDNLNRYGRLAWTSDTKMPALLIEWGFIDSLPDMDTILSDIPGGVKVLLDTVVGGTVQIPAKLTASQPTITIGSVNRQAVKNWQNRLLALGYKLPKYGADGDFGGETAAATRQFQKDHNLVVDCIVGPKTYGAAGM